MSGSSDTLRNRALLVAGIALVLAGLVLNVWTVTYLFNHIGLMTPELKVMIWSFDLVCAAGGFALIRYRERIRGKEVVFFLLTIVLLLLLMEGGVRLFLAVKHAIVPRERNLSDYLGWDVQANFQSDRVKKGYGRVKYSTVRDGFRVFGDPATIKTKVLVLGDSVTQAYTVSDGEAYYDYLGKHRPDVEIFAYGCGGYGTLQEYMILDKFIDQIRPDIILWQFSDNDIINNDHGLESTTHINNNHMIRPYYRDGKIEWLYPKQDFGLARTIVQSSYILRFLSIRLRMFRAQYIEHSIEDDLTEDHPLLLRSAATTEAILTMAKKRAGAAPIVAFNAAEAKWLGNTFVRISKSVGIRYIPGIDDAIIAASKEGIIVNGNPYDGHWNATGHAIAGRLILKYIVDQGILPRKPGANRPGRHDG